MKVFWLDSLHGKPNLELKLFVDTGLKALVVKRKMPSLTWELIKGLYQSGSTECGFYVLNFMRALIGDPSKPIKAKMNELVGKASYENHELYELQHEFVEFIQGYMH